MFIYGSPKYQLSKTTSADLIVSKAICPNSIKAICPSIDDDRLMLMAPKGISLSPQRHGFASNVNIFTLKSCFLLFSTFMKLKVDATLGGMHR